LRVIDGSIVNNFKTRALIRRMTSPYTLIASLRMIPCRSQFTWLQA
jgi:hypothetical protein